MPWYKMASEFQTPYDDIYNAHSSVSNVQAFDQNHNILVCLAHDTVLLDIMPIFYENPRKDINGWRERGLKDKCHGVGWARFLSMESRHRIHWSKAFGDMISRGITCHSKRPWKPLLSDNWQCSLLCWRLFWLFLGGEDSKVRNFNPRALVSPVEDISWWIYMQPSAREALLYYTMTSYSAMCGNCRVFGKTSLRCNITSFADRISKVLKYAT